MRVSPAGRAAIRQREGCRLSAYRDSVNVLTIGVGHTGRMSAPPVTSGMRISTAEADAFLASDLGPVEAAIAKAVRVPMSQNQCDALASLAFNIGTGGFARSTVVSRLNQGDYAGAAAAFMLWSKPAVLAGRRRAEKAQFLTPDAPQEMALTPAKPVPASPSPAPAASAPRAPAAAPASRPGVFARIAYFFSRH